jgi:hypothetical protein
MTLEAFEREQRDLDRLLPNGASLEA